MANTTYQNNFENYIYRLALYYHLNAMEPFQAENFAKLKADKKLNAAQTKWDSSTKPDPNSPTITDVDGNSSPNPVYLNDEQWEQLYKVFGGTFRNMAKHTADLNQKKTLPFFTKYYNTNAAIGVFGPAHIPASNVTDMGDLAQYMEDHAETILPIVRSDIKTRTEYNAFVANLRNPNNAPADFTEKLTNVLVSINNKAYESASVDDGLNINPFGDKQTAINVYGLTSKLYNNIGDEKISTTRLAHFKAEFSKNGGILETLFKNGKTIGTDFASNGGGSVIGIIDKAKEENNYKEGDNAIVGKDKDVLTHADKIKKNVNDAIDASIGKMEQRHRREIYDHPAASSIVESIIKAKVKPTDGLEAIIKNADAIKGKIAKSHPGAIADFNWFISQLKEVQDQMPKAFAGGLRNGRQLNAIVKHMIKNAAKSGDKSKCMVAMEVLSVIQYDNFSSKIRNEFFKQDFNLLKGTSLEKSEAGKIISKGLAMGLKLGARAVFETANFVKNRVNKTGLTFRKKALIDAKTNVSTVRNDIDFNALATGAQNWTVQEAEQNAQTAQQVLQTKQQELQRKQAEVQQAEQAIAQLNQQLQPFLDAQQAIEDADKDYKDASDEALEKVRGLKDIKNVRDAGNTLTTTDLANERKWKPELRNALGRRGPALLKKQTAQNLLATNPNLQQQIQQLDTMQTNLGVLKGEESQLTTDVEVAQADFDIKDFIHNQKLQAETMATDESNDVYEMMQYWNYKNKIAERVKRNDLNILRGQKHHKAQQAAYDANNQNLALFMQYAQQHQ